jgi:hypothetical protein
MDKMSLPRRAASTMVCQTCRILPDGSRLLNRCHVQVPLPELHGVLTARLREASKTLYIVDN